MGGIEVVPGLDPDLLARVVRLLRELEQTTSGRSETDSTRSRLRCRSRVVPKHYHEDLPVMLGLVGASDALVTHSALRLGSELLAFLRERKPDADPQPDIARYLADGTLERHLGFI